LPKKISGIEAERVQMRWEYLALEARGDSIKALTPEEFKRCFAAALCIMVAAKAGSEMLIQKP
jgi:hypothetical protein